MTAEERAAVADWTAVLDEMERELAVLTEQLIGGLLTSAPAPFAPPADLPPLPASLACRAAFILDRSKTVEAELQARAEQAGSRLRGLERQVAERRPMRPAFFDQAV